MTLPLQTVGRHRRAYDHRLREHVCRKGVRAVPRVKIPPSTIKSWKRRGLRPVVTLAPFSQDQQDLAARIDKLDRRVQILAAVVRLLLALLRASRFRLDEERLPEGDAKAGILRAVASTQAALPLAIALRILKLTPSRYHAWKRSAQVCGLDDRPSCPRSSPGRLTAAEVATVKEMVLSPEHRHMPLGTLALYAQRLGKVFASVTTWSRLVRERAWRRPRQRVHPPKPKVGVRANRPNEIWHLDTTVIRLLDGTRAFVHAVIDNYSRKILAWAVAARLDPTSTCQVLLAAGRHLVSAGRPDLYADSGVENVNAAVDKTLSSTGIHRVLAQVEVAFSNSMIEAFWRSMKHGWLYLNSLDSVEHLRSLVTFFVESHNTQMPHSAFDGQTPDEVYFGTAASLPEELAAARAKARAARLAGNRALSCARCEPTSSPPVMPEIPP